MTTTAGAHVVPHESPSLPELRAANQGVAESLEAVLADNTRRTYDAQWRLFAGWCDQVGLTSLPAAPSPWPATWPPAPTPAPPSPPCAWPPVRFRKPTNGRSWSRPAGTRACAPL